MHSFNFWDWSLKFCIILSCTFLCFKKIWAILSVSSSRAGCIPNHYGVRSTISGCSRRLDLRLGPLSPCKWRAKKYHFAGVPRRREPASAAGLLQTTSCMLVTWYKVLGIYLTNYKIQYNDQLIKCAGGNIKRNSCIFVSLLNSIGKTVMDTNHIK